MVGYHLYLCSPDVAVELFNSPHKRQTLLLGNGIVTFSFCQQPARESDWSLPLHSFLDQCRPNPVVASVGVDLKRF